MKAILRILELAGGYRRDLYLRIENPPFMALVIEAMPEPGPCGGPALSVAHYGEQNSDAMRDPEMGFELIGPCGRTLAPYYFRNDYLGVEQYSRENNVTGYVFRPVMFDGHESFAAMWDENLRAQGFVDAFEKARTQ